MLGRRRGRRTGPLSEEAMDSLAEAVRAVGDAKDALAAARPSRRGEGAPLAEALAGFEERLAAADRAMPGWRVDGMADEWAACARALAECRTRAEALRLGPQAPEGYERLYAVLGELMDPLDAFEDAVEALRRG